METHKIKVKYHKDGARPIVQAHIGEWADLRLPEDRYFAKGETGLIDLGISMELPEGYEAIVLPRSSTPEKWGLELRNGEGVIDYLYKGNEDRWMFNYKSKKNIKVPAGTRIAQFRIQPQQGILEFEEVETLGNDNRGGNNSTGTI